MVFPGPVERRDRTVSSADIFDGYPYLFFGIRVFVLVLSRPTSHPVV